MIRSCQRIFLLTLSRAKFNKCLHKCKHKQRTNRCEFCFTMHMSTSLPSVQSWPLSSVSPLLSHIFLVNISTFFFPRILDSIKEPIKGHSNYERDNYSGNSRTHYMYINRHEKIVFYKFEKYPVNNTWMTHIWYYIDPSRLIHMTCKDYTSANIFVFLERLGVFNYTCSFKKFDVKDHRPIYVNI